MMELLKRRLALGEFLRKRRVSFVQAPSATLVGRRRRTSGMRREEIAQLAGMSTIWYTRLEQGKEISPSSVALSRIANAFEFTPAERHYLFNLAGRVDPQYVPPDDIELIAAAMKDCILAIETPAYLLDRYMTPQVWNNEAAKIFKLWLKGPEINLLRHIFLDPHATSFLVDWELRAHQILAQFRIDYAYHIDDPKMSELVENLKKNSNFFREAWDNQQVMFRTGHERSYNHPSLGPLSYFQSTYVSSADPSLKLVILTPRDNRSQRTSTVRKRSSA
jgi:transcriptional regulator with XRE-family HTH domain